MTFFRLALFVFIFSACSQRSIKSEQRAHYHLQIGNGLLSKGLYPAALSEFLKAEELDPENAVIQNQLGLAYFVRNQVDKAETHFKKAIFLEPKFTEARNNLGRVYIEKKQYRSAIQELNVAAKDLLYSEPDKIQSNLGLAFFNLKDYSQAEKYFYEALKIQRKNCFALTYYGRSLYELSSYDKAAESLDLAMETCKNLKVEDPYYYSALSYMKTGQREQAVARLEEGLNLYPQGELAPKARSMLEILK